MIRLGGFILLLVLLQSCGGAEEKVVDRTADKNGGILVMNQFQSFSTLFPPSAYESSSAQVGSHIYETLIGYDPKSKEPIPMLAESWSSNDSSTEFTFSIRPGVYFHNDECFPGGEGRLMTIDDVLFCLKALCENNGTNKNSWLFTGIVKGAMEFFDGKKSAQDDELAGIEKISDTEIIIRLNKPNVEFIHVLAHYGTSIYPTEAITHYGKDIDRHPVGTGPFKSKVLRTNEICIMQRNKRYWAQDADGNQLPYLDGLKIGFSPTGYAVAEAMEKELLHVVVDADMVEGGEAIGKIISNDYSIYSKHSELDLETVYLGFLNDEGVFQSPKVRAAFGLAIDKNKITEEGLFNSGTPGLYGLIPPAFPNYPYHEINGFSTDVERAKLLLAEAGYPDGEGFPVMTLQIQNRYKDVVVAQEIQKQILENLGISLSITALPRDQHFARTEARQAQLWIDNWSGDFIDPQNFLNLMLARNTPEEGASYLNIYRYRNPSYDSIVDEAIKVKDLKKRMHLYSLADIKLMRDAAIIPIYYEKNQVIEHTNVKNLNSPILGRLDLREVYLQKDN